MTGKQIIEKVKALNLPKGSYVVFGSCPMALAGIREAGDIDLLASAEVRKRFEKEGWQEVDKGPNDKPLTKDDYEIHDNWNFSSYQPTLEQLLSTATVVDNVPFASLEEVRKWKESSGRPKDLEDIKRIDAYMATLK
jgi:hypothetical protein